MNNKKKYENMKSISSKFDYDKPQSEATNKPGKRAIVENQIKSDRSEVWEVSHEYVSGF